MSVSGRTIPRKGLEYICHTCGKGMGKRYKQNHRISSLESCLKCKVCKKSFSMGFANKKIKPHREESYSCEVCKKEFKNECFLTYHLFEHSNDWPCRCSVCKKGFALPSHLKKHMCYHASNDELKFKCSVCPLMFKSKESLKEHGMFHLSVYKWKCNECKKGFLFESDMKKHMRTHNNGLKYECSCGFEAKSQSNLDKHSMFHTREYTKKFKLKCEVCSKGFGFQSELKQHMSKHSNDRNFRCILCSSEFKHKNELLKHKLIHTGEYKLKCDFCSKGFVFQSEQKAHDESCQYQCGICLLKFANQTELTKHSQIHTGQYKYKCGVCSRLFPNKLNVSKHVQTHSENVSFHTNNIFENFEEAINDLRSGAQTLKCDWCNFECVSELFLKQHKQIYHQTAMVILTYPDSDTYDHSASLVFHTNDIIADSEEVVENPNTEYTEYTGTPSVKCDLCSYECDSESVLGQHKQLYHQTVMVLLTHSDGDIQTQSDLVFHTSDILVNSKEAVDDPDSEHGGMLSFKCDLCSYDCDSESALGQHKQLYHQTVMVLLTHSDGDIQTQSDLVFNTSDILVNSKEAVDDPDSEHGGILSFKCDLCSYDCDSESALRQHKQLYHHTVMVLLTHSDGDIQTQSDLVFHTSDILVYSKEAVDDPDSEHGGMLSFKCDLCSYDCDSESALGQHKQLYHQTVMVLLTHSDGDIQTQSDLVFNTSDILVNSKEAVDDPDSEHGGILSFKCDLCSYDCDSESALRQHKQLYHQTVMVLLTHSDADMHTQSDLVFHTSDILVNSEEDVDDPSSEYIGYTGTKSVKCDLCGYECDSESALGQHKEVHHQTILTAVKNSNSDMHAESENLVIGTNEILLNSIETVENPNSEHGGMLSFKCDLCSYDCDSELLLGQHKQLYHQTVKVLLTHSDGGMDSQSDLVFHTNDIIVDSKEDADDPSSEYIRYTGTKSVKCDLCGYECDSESALGEHIEVHHQTILTNVENPNSDMHTESGDLGFGTNDILTNSEEVLDNPNLEYIEYTETQSHKCDLCNYESDSESALGQHMQQYHQTILTIIKNTDSDTESRDFVSETNELFSTSEYTGTPSFKCNVCNYECESKLFFEKHKQIYHQTIPSIVTNPDSDMQTQSDLIFGTNKTVSNIEGALDYPNSEYNGYTGTQSFKCGFCSYECDSELLLGQHKEVHHQKILAIVTNPDSEMRTESEDRDFVNNEILSIPEETVANSTSECIRNEFFQCDLCSFQSESELLLGQHKQLYHQTVMVSQTHPDSDMNVQSANLAFHTNDILVNSEEVVYDPNSKYIGYTGTHLLKCDLCSYECDSESALGKHKEVHYKTTLTIVENSNSDMHTESRDLVFRSNEILLNSIEAVENPISEHRLTQSFKCDLCNFECDCESVLGHHRQVFHQTILTIIKNTDNDMQTQSGDLVSGTNVILVNTEEIVEDPNSEYTGAQSLSCDLCSYECDSELLLGQHKQMYHQTILITVTNPDRDMQTQSRGLVSGTHEIFLNTERAIDYPNLEYTGHTVTQSFKCDLGSLCSYECDSESALEQHTEVYHQTILTIVTNPENGLHPQLGDQSFQTNEIFANSEEAVDNLTLVHIGTQSFKCDLCNYEFDSELVLEQHKQVYHRNILTIVTNSNNETYTQSENFVIGANDILVNSEEANYDPISEYTEVQSFRCDLCNYECDSELLLGQHKQVYHQTILAIVPNPNNAMQLQSGNLVLGNNEILTNSEEAVDNPNSEYIGYIEALSFKCDLCGYECDSELLLEQHKHLCHQTVMVIVTNPDSGLPIHSADVILQTEGNLANFDEAIENPTSTYTGANSFECNICPYECDSELLLEQHKQVYHQTILTIVTNTENDMHTESENFVFQSNNNHSNSEVAVYGPLPECIGIQSLKCDLCSYECDSELLLGQHKQLYHPTIMVLVTHPDNDMQPKSGDLVLGTNEIIVNPEEAVDDPNSEFTGCTEAESFKCDMCGYECDSELLLGQHKQVYHQTFLTILPNPESNMPIQSGAIVFQTNDIMSANSEERS
ncbi:zinc finger protein 91 [Trichonephila clavipes]|nr:zinc finger protein 91 [Trichonephila clavipes]